MAAWATEVGSAQVRVGACVIDAVPVARKRYSDWWLWWVPLPHVGGTPIASYTISLHIDSARCAAEKAPY